MVILISILSARYVLDYGPTLKYKDRKLSTFFQNHLRLIEDDVERLAIGDVSVRANIMRPTNRGLLSDKEFEIAYYNSEEDYDEEEFELTFKENQGVVGSTYATGTESIAVSQDQLSGWEDGWETTATQDRVTSHLETIIGIPVYRPSDDEREDDPTAVLIVDSENSLAEFIENPGEPLDDEFKNSELADELTTHASNVGILL